MARRKSCVTGHQCSPVTAWLPGVDVTSLPFASIPCGSAALHSPRVPPALLNTLFTQMIAARQRTLARWSLEEVIERMSRWAQAWRDPQFAWRQLAIEWVPQTSGFSSQTIADGIDVAFAEIHPGKLAELVRKELDPSSVGQIGPPLTVQWLAGNIPALAVMALVSGLLTRSAQFVKPSSQEPLFAPVLAASWQDVDPEMAACIAALWWPGGHSDLESIVLTTADVVVAYGDDVTLRGLQARVPNKARFIGYGHKWSVALIGREQMTIDAIPPLAAALAQDMTLYDQLGCLAPQIVYVECGGSALMDTLARALAMALKTYGMQRPAGCWGTTTFAAVRGLRDHYDMRQLAGEAVSVYGSERTLDWTIIIDPTARCEPASLPRVIRITPVDQLEDILVWLQPWKGQLSTVGVSLSPARLARLTPGLSALGVWRYCPLGQMQRPSLLEGHDGRPRLVALVGE